jgi:oxygen-independent coproporphyrinogen-3 oxidase
VRSANPDDLDAYIRGINSGTLQRESETLTEKDRYNERIMLGLRTDRGIAGPIPSQSRAIIERLMPKGLLRETEDGRIVATQQGLHVLNRIIEDLMI